MDPSGYYFEEYFDINDIINDLLQDNYCCWNYFQKYYVVAFAIDYKTFKIRSKDCDKKIIDWKEKNLEEITL